MRNNLLRALIDMREQLQKARIQFENRARALDEGTDAGLPAQSALVQRWAETFLRLEKDADGDIRSQVRDEPVFEYLSRVKGVGPILAARLLSMIDFSRAPTVSSLWRFAGYGVIDGKAERPRQGEKLHYNRRLKTSLYLVAVSFLRSNSPYRRIYDDARAFYASQRPDWTPMHIHLASLRKMVKVFLQHLWWYGRILHGLPVTQPYVHDRLGHDSYLSPAEFGWPELRAEAAAAEQA